MRKWILISTIILILVSGCQDRKVTKITEVDENTIDNELEDINQSTSLDNTEQLGEPKASPSVTLSPAPSEIPKPSQDENVVTPTAQNNIIITKSKDLAADDERAQILNEIDNLLDSTLSNLDELEEDTLSDDNIVNEGGLQ